MLTFLKAGIYWKIRPALWEGGNIGQYNLGGKVWRGGEKKKENEKEKEDKGNIKGQFKLKRKMIVKGAKIKASKSK
jgi:hypothetical protein